MSQFFSSHLRGIVKLIILSLILVSCSKDKNIDDSQIDEDQMSNGEVEENLNNAVLERVASFGPNGTHWPNVIPTPFMYDETVPNQIIVDNDWGAIKEGIETVTDEMANEGTLILVRPGTLVGSGTNKSVLIGLGSLDWKKRITIAPLEGYGSITVTGGTKYHTLYNIAIAGFIYDALNIQGLSHSAIAWSKVLGWSGYNGEDDIVTENLEIVEVVHPDSKVDNGDTADAFTAGGSLDKLFFVGCYYAPRFFHYPIQGSAKPHTDTLQFAQVNGGGQPSNITFLDSALFSSNNTSLQTGGTNGLILNHSYLVSGDVSLSRYPHLPGGATEATVNAINGAGQNFEAHDSIILGGIALNTSTTPQPWKEVTNTLVDREHLRSNVPLSGAWTVDMSLDETNSGMPPYPTPEYLESIWAKQ